MRIPYVIDNTAYESVGAKNRKLIGLRIFVLIS